MKRANLLVSKCLDYIAVFLYHRFRWMLLKLFEQHHDLATQFVLCLVEQDRIGVPKEYHTLSVKYGHHIRGIATVLNRDSEPIPWFTYPAIEYLQQLDLRDKKVFEWGCGNSSLYFSKRAKLVYTIESDPEWFAKVKEAKPANLSLLLVEEERYPEAIQIPGRKFNIIVIDGIRRYECASTAHRFLEDNGMIILDNSDWFRESAKHLRDQGLIQIDMHGFGPLNNYTWTTSFFFNRSFHFAPLDNIQPAHPIGGLIQLLE